jgi:hypothetical protein
MEKTGHILWLEFISGPAMKSSMVLPTRRRGGSQGSDMSHIMGVSQELLDFLCGDDSRPICCCSHLTSVAEADLAARLAYTLETC